MQGLPGTNLVSFSIRLNSNMQAVASLEIATNNPSTFAFRPLGNFSMMAHVNGFQVVNASVWNVSIPRGAFYLSAEALLTPSLINNNNPGALMMFSNFIARQPTQLIAKNASCSNMIYTPAMSTLALPLMLPGASRDLLVSAIATLDLSYMLWQLLTRFAITIPTRLVLHNPLDAPVTVTRMQFQIFFQGNEVLTINTNLMYDGSPMRILLPAQSTTLTFSVGGMANVYGFGAMYDLLVLFLESLSMGRVNVNVDGMMDIQLADVMLTLPYALMDVPVCPDSNTVGCPMH